MTDRALALLAAAHPGDPNDPASWRAYARLAPHVLATSPLGDDHPDTRRLMLATTRYLQLTADPRASQRITQELLDRWRRVLGPDHPDTLRSAANLAFTLTWLGEPEQARTLGHDTLERCRRVLGPDHPDTLRLAQALDLLTSARQQCQHQLLPLLSPWHHQRSKRS
jgi:hypothetical protein